MSLDWGRNPTQLGENMNTQLDSRGGIWTSGGECWRCECYKLRHTHCHSDQLPALSVNEKQTPTEGHIYNVIRKSRADLVDVEAKSQVREILRC